MIESVIVTISNNKDINVDMELPVNILISELSTKLLSSLIERYPRELSGKEQIILKHNGDMLLKDKTLYEVGVWDGSILEFD